MYSSPLSGMKAKSLRQTPRVLLQVLQSRKMSLLRSTDERPDTTAAPDAGLADEEWEFVISEVDVVVRHLGLAGLTECDAEAVEGFSIAAIALRESKVSGCSRGAELGAFAAGRDLVGMDDTVWTCVSSIIHQRKRSNPPCSSLTVQMNSLSKRGKRGVGDFSAFASLMQ